MIKQQKQKHHNNQQLNKNQLKALNYHKLSIKHSHTVPKEKEETDLNQVFPYQKKNKNTPDSRSRWTQLCQWLANTFQLVSLINYMWRLKLCTDSWLICLNNTYAFIKLPKIHDRYKMKHWHKDSFNIYYNTRINNLQYGKKYFWKSKLYFHFCLHIIQVNLPPGFMRTPKQDEIIYTLIHHTCGKILPYY